MENNLFQQFEKQLHMLLEENRFATYTKWPFSNEEKCSSKKMAEAGFYCIGDDDLVTCFMCRKELDGWESEDDPWNEHLKHAPYCAYVKLGKNICELTVPQFFDLKQQQVFLALDKFAADRYEADLEELNKIKKLIIKK